jgi:hypothetical protein
MRLIHARSLRLEEFFDDSVPQYAILSHTWGRDEVTLHEMQQFAAHGGPVSARSGFRKIQGTCAKALEDGLEYAWVDTCCIDKTSSAELTEAINSMFAWYRGANRCYAYLSDVAENVRPLTDMTNEELTSKEVPIRGLAFQSSLWFTRGWTLQELLAPDHVYFYGEAWNFLGTKLSLYNMISAITGIDRAILWKPMSIFSPSLCIAKKMSWASKRRTSRVEDLAYCLLGIFGVNMPLIYGEGRNSFVRLQEAIIGVSDDHSIFAWNILPGDIDPGTGFLATTPAQFSGSARTVRFLDSAVNSNEPYSTTNKGLRIRLPVINGIKDGYSILVLACRYEDNLQGPIGILCKRSDSTYLEECSTANTTRTQLCVVDMADLQIANLFQTVHLSRTRLHAMQQRSHEVAYTDRFLEPQGAKCWLRTLKGSFSCSFYYSDQGRHLNAKPILLYPSAKSITVPEGRDGPFTLIVNELYPAQHWNREGRTLWIPGRLKVAAAFSMTISEGQDFAVCFGFAVGNATCGTEWISITPRGVRRSLKSICDTASAQMDANVRKTSASLQFSRVSEMAIPASDHTLTAAIKGEQVFGEHVFAIDVTVTSAEKLET